jgi:outer membrane protein
MVRFLAVAVVLAGGLAGSAWAEPTADGEVPLQLSLQDALALARQNPPVVLAADARARAAAAQVEVVRAMLGPRVGANLGLSASALQTTILYGASNIPEGLVFPGIVPTAALDAFVTVSWPLWDFGRTRLALNAAKHGVASANEEVRGARHQAMMLVAVAYFTMLSNQEFVVELRQTLRKRESDAEIAKGLVNSGARAPFEHMRAEVALESARTDLVVAEGLARQAAVTLAAALGLDPTRELLVSVPATTPLDANEGRAIESAIASRPEVRAARARLAQAERQLAAARAGYRPLLTASASLGGSYVNRITSDAVSAQGAGSLVLSVPFLDPALSANVQMNEANVAAANAAALQVDQAVKSEAVQAAIALDTARATLAQADRVAKAAATTLLQAQGRYASGSMPLVELLDVQGAEVTAGVGVIRARLNVELATVQLLSATGRLDDLLGSN